MKNVWIVLILNTMSFGVMAVSIYSQFEFNFSIKLIVPLGIILGTNLSVLLTLFSERGK